MQQGVAVYGISIHALREEGDQSGKRGSLRKGDFYPRPPRGGRLFHPNKSSGFVSISIHALREEGDLDSDPPEPRPVGISIHALREEGDHRT